MTQTLEESLSEFVGFFEEFVQHMSIVETQVFDHFQEIRFQIDERREEMKKKIDDIALAMIDKVKEFEVIYMKSVNENLLETQSSFDEEANWIDKELKDQLRNPNLLI